jgi:hypothetical protein
LVDLPKISFLATETHGSVGSDRVYL